MIEQIKNIADRIKATHAWFDDVYAPCWFDEKTGRILMGDNFDYRQIGIDDRLGNYAYIRYSGNIRYDENRKAGTGCLGAITKVLPCTLVAVLLDGDVSKLETCLVNTLLSFPTIKISSCELLTVNVLANELKYADAATLDEALHNIDRYTLLSIDFSIIGEQISLSINCPCNPCKSC